MVAVFLVHAKRAKLQTITMFFESADPPDFSFFLRHPEIIRGHAGVIEIVRLGELENLGEVGFSCFSDTHDAYYTNI